MAIKIRCDRCGITVSKDDACALILVQRAFVKGGGEKKQFELCPDCLSGVEKILTNMEGKNGL